MKAIVSVDRNWAIGYKGQLLARISEDLKRFRRLTEGHTVLMGRATLESLPGGRPLKNRQNLVLSSTLEPGEGYRVFRTAEELRQYLAEDPSAPASDDIFLIGGASVYEAFLADCSSVLLTQIDGDFPADRWYPDLDALAEWEPLEAEPWQEEEGLRYRYIEYVKKVD